MDKRPRNFYKVEFTVNLPAIKEKVKNGVIAINILYQELLDDKKITMSYHNFWNYCRQFEVLKEYEQEVKKDISLDMAIRADEGTKGWQEAASFEELQKQEKRSLPDMNIEVGQVNDIVLAPKADGIKKAHESAAKIYQPIINDELLTEIYGKPPKKDKN